MFDDSGAFLSRAYLEREWALEYKGWRDSEAEAALLARLRAWAERPDLRERSAVAPFVQTFFVDTWGYEQAGRGGEWTSYPEYPIAGAGAGGAQGSADLALGWFDAQRPTPQVLCEFKDIRSDLDAPQPRKGNTRSPVRQCLDYVAGVKRTVFPNDPVQPWWGLVSDMNEFRLYWWDRAPDHLRFVIRSRTPLVESSLIDGTEEARFNRFVFAKLFGRDQLLSRGGRPAELLQRVHAAEAGYRPLSSSEREVGVLHPVVGPATNLPILGVAELLHGRAVGAQPVGGDRLRGAVALQRLLDELQRRSLVPILGDKGSSTSPS